MVIWGYISSERPAPGLVSPVICLIIYKFTAAPSQTSSALTNGCVHAKAGTCRLSLNDQSCICPQVFLLYARTLTSTNCPMILSPGPLDRGESGGDSLGHPPPPKFYPGQRNPLPGQQVAAINCCQTNTGQWLERNFNHAFLWASKATKLIFHRRWEKGRPPFPPPHIWQPPHMKKREISASRSTSSPQPTTKSTKGIRKLYYPTGSSSPVTRKYIFADALVKTLLLQSHLQGKPPMRVNLPWGQTSHEESL